MINTQSIHKFADGEVVVTGKGTDGLWVLHPFEAGQAVHLAAWRST